MKLFAFTVLAAFLLSLTGRHVDAAGSRLAARSWNQDTGMMVFPRGGGRCDQNSQHSPFRLQYYSSTKVPGGNIVCFHVLLVPCDPKDRCCLGHDLFKAEFEVEPTCKSSLHRVTLDGEEHDYEYNTAQRVLRVTNINRQTVNAAGTQICLLLRGQCTGLDSLCAGSGGQCRYALFNGGRRDCCPVGRAGPAPPPTPPPQSPPTAQASKSGAFVGAVKPIQQAQQQQQQGQVTMPPSQFPYAQCQRDASQSRYSLSDASVSPFLDLDSDDLSRICFTVETKSDCNTQGVAPACCEFDLQKVEFDVSAECYGALSYVSVGGVRRPPFFQSMTNPTIKIMNLNLHSSSVKGTEICLFMRKQCNTLEQLCRRPDGRCEYSIFSAPLADGGRCCPVGLAGTMPVGAESMVVG